MVFDRAESVDELLKVNVLCLGFELFGNEEESRVANCWLNFGHLDFVAFHEIDLYLFLVQLNHDQARVCL